MRINPCLNSKSVGERKEKLENYEGPNEIKIAPITKFCVNYINENVGKMLHGAMSLRICVEQ